jgi:oxygen-independent coproporphyrinogen-3 oxidase
MKLLLTGHAYRYAVEQIMLMLFPEERPEYVDNASDLAGTAASVRLTRSRAFDTATTRLFYRGEVFLGVARRRRCEGDALETDRVLQRLIKTSFYRAAVRATGKKPVWGALTGIRPGKIATALLEAGKSEKSVLRTLVREYYLAPDRAALCLDTARAGLRAERSLGKRDIALYIGIPFCPTRCAYCSFVSHSVEKSMALIEPFLDALRREIDAAADIVRRLNLSVACVYIGGGTPTTLSDKQLESLLRHLNAAFNLSRVREFTVEAGRPDTITPEKLAALKSGGVNRVSVNPQTMCDDVLRAIGRRHTAEETLSAMRLVRKAGFDCVNMDLIAGLPGDTVGTFCRSLDEVLSLRPENVTVHTLSLKKGTRITLDKTPIPGGGEVGEMLDYASERLRAGGYGPYYLYRQKFTSGGFENVGWSLPGYDSLYNILIMEELRTVVALGGGGVTKLVAPEVGRIERIFNAKYPYEYIGGIDELIARKSGIESFYARFIDG